MTFEMAHGGAVAEALPHKPEEGSIPDGALGFFIELILPAAPWFWGWLSP